jgi:hypothetical protein
MKNSQQLADWYSNVSNELIKKGQQLVDWYCKVTSCLIRMVSNWWIDTAM